MGVRLTALPRYLDKWGVRYELVDGWETRSRSSGDFVDIMGIGTHHTASTTTPERDETWCIRNSPDRPIGNGLLLRDGRFRLWSVRATNTQGRGGPYLTSRGTIPKDSGNTRIFAVEAANNGVGETWPGVMVDSYIKLCAALVECISDTTPGAALQVGDIVSHFEWAPGRKFDPAGNSPYASGGALWRMDDFRRDIYTALNPPPLSQTNPGDDGEEDDDMKKFLVQAPDGHWYVTDTVTYKTWVDNTSVGAEGIALFGWQGADSDEPIILGAGWGPHMDRLPTTAPVH